MEFSEQVPAFLEGFLSRPAFALPKGAFWVVDFESLSDVRGAIAQTIQLEPRGWNVDQALNYLVLNSRTAEKGCFFVQAISVPEESMVANPEGFQYNHFIRTNVGGGRNPNNLLRMTFLNTNVSFVENVIRPWVVTTGRLGLVARPTDPQLNQNYRQNITLYKLGIISPSVPPFVLEKYTFFGACPIEVNSEEYNYTPGSSPVLREAVFTFNYYQIETNSNIGALISDNTSTPPLPLATEFKGSNVFKPSIPVQKPDTRYSL